MPCRSTILPRPRLPSDRPRDRRRRPRLPPPGADLDALYGWRGGHHDNFSDQNWDGGLNGTLLPDYVYGVGLAFGKFTSGDEPTDDNGIVDNDIQDGLLLKRLGFFNQSWTMNGRPLRLVARIEGLDVVQADATSPFSIITNNLTIYRPTLQETSCGFYVDDPSVLALTGTINGDGSVYKDGNGALVVTGTHAYNGGTVVGAGSLVDYHPFGNYDIRPDATLEFHTATDQSFIWSVAGDGAFTKSGAGTLNLTGSVGYTGATVVNAGTLILQVPKSSSVTIASSAIFETRMNQTATYAGRISGAGTFIKSGTGTLTRSGTNDFTGLTEVDAGSLIDLHPHGDYYNVATLTFNVADAQTYSGSISGSGTVNKTGAGTLTRTGVNYDESTTNVQAGRLIDLYPSFGDYYVYGNAALELQTATRDTFAGRISGLGSLTKSGAGTLTLSDQDTTTYSDYTGGTTVSSGRLIDQHPHGNYVTNADLEFANATNVDFQTPVPIGPASFNQISGTGSFTKSGAGALILYMPSTYAGSTTINGGAIVMLGKDFLPTATDLTVGASGQFLMAGAQTVASLAGAGHVGTNGSAFTVSGSGSTTFSGVVSDSGSLTKAGAGTLTLTGANAYTGGTTVNAGRLVDLNPHGDYVTNATLEFSNASDAAYGRTVDGTGTFVKSGAGTLAFAGSIKPGVTTQIAGGTLKASGGGLYGDVVGAAGTTFQLTGGTYPAAFSGAGALLAGGGVTLAQAPSNTGGVRVTDRDLTVKGAGTFGGGLTVDANATFGNASGGTLTVRGGATNQGSVDTRAGSRTAFTAFVSGAGAFTGPGVVEFGGGYGPGNGPASVSFQGAFALSPANVLAMELGGTALGAGYDHLTVAGTAFLGGALKVVTLNGFSPTLGQSFDLFDFGSSNGTFASVSLPTLGNGLAWDTSSLYTTGVIRTQAVPEPTTLAALGLGALTFLRRRRK